jgi:hypothetical protein
MRNYSSLKSIEVYSNFIAVGVCTNYIVNVTSALGIQFNLKIIKCVTPSENKMIIKCTSVKRAFTVEFS